MHYTKKELILETLILYSLPLPANVQVLLDRVWELLTIVTGGRSACESFAILDRNGSWLKTSGGCCQLMLDGSLEKYSGSWPKWGMMLNGECMKPPTSERRTNGKESSLWPTATVNGNYNRKGVSDTSGDGLATAVRNWPTPSTPSAADRQGSHGGGQARSLRTDVHGSGGQLNPDWVEPLMGYPIGWTDINKARSFDLFRRREIWEVFSQLWPARPSELQYGWEPPRTTRISKGRPGRIKMLGNSVVPQWAYLVLLAIYQLEMNTRTQIERT